MEDVIAQEEENENNDTISIINSVISSNNNDILLDINQQLGIIVNDLTNKEVAKTKNQLQSIILQIIEN